LDYYDVQTVDQIVDRLEQGQGRPSVLLMAVVESAPFQKTRTRATQAGRDTAPVPTPHPAQSASQLNPGLHSGHKELTVVAHHTPDNEPRP